MISQTLISMINYFGKDTKRINHALKVHSYAKIIGNLQGLSQESQFVLEMAAILHDIGIKESEKKYGSSSGKYQELEGPDVAMELLSDFNLSHAELNRICYLIGNHHSYNKIDDLDFQILIESDFLVNVNEDNIKRESIISIKEKYFKTSTGINIINSQFL